MVAVVVPSVANADAQRKLNEARDVEEPFERITSAVKRRKIAKHLLEAGEITDHEYGQHEAFVTKCSDVANDDMVAANDAVTANDGVPPWFGPALADALAPVLARLDGIDGRLDDIDARQRNVEARLVNSVASDPTDPLQGIRNAEGNVARNFPPDYVSLNIMKPRAMTAFLRHYGLLDEEDDEVRKHQRIKKFIGLRIA
jgi:hypothetical protein